MYNITMTSNYLVAMVTNTVKIFMVLRLNFYMNMKT